MFYHSEYRKYIHAHTDIYVYKMNKQIDTYNQQIIKYMIKYENKQISKQYKYMEK